MTNDNTSPWSSPSADGPGAIPPPPQFTIDGDATSAGFGAPPAVDTGAGVGAVPGAPSIVVQSHDAPKNNRKKLLLLGGVGALVVGAVAVVATRSLGGEASGADSPTDAITEMMVAVADEDALTMVNLMAPSELRSLTSATSELSDFWNRKGEAYESLKDRGFDFDPDDPIPGFTLTLADLAYDSEEDNGVAKVTITSLDAEWEFDPEGFVDKVDLDRLSDGAISNDDFTDEFEGASGSFDQNDLQVFDDDPFLMTVEEDGKWYVSPTYTLLEYLRVSEDLEEPTFGADTSDSGAESPEAALEEILEAAGDNDVEAVINLLPPSRYQAFYDYAEPLSQLADGSGSTDVKVTVDELTKLDDGTYELTDVTIETDDGFRTQTAHIEGPCLTIETAYSDGFEDDPVEICINDLGDDLPEELEGFSDGIPGIDTLWVALREENGRWYVDPFGTLGSYIEAVDQEELSDIMDDVINGIEG